LLDSVEHIIATFQQLRDLGVKLAIDDLAPAIRRSATSSASRGLREDRPGLHPRPGRGREDAAITRAIIAMAHGLALKVVAEGVEDQQQLDFLRQGVAMRCRAT
jgi:EAL domain-containing protein (putative c-di-GMP-specific phosphodiesterase class I)